MTSRGVSDTHTHTQQTDKQETQGSREHTLQPSISRMEELGSQTGPETDTRREIFNERH